MKARFACVLLLAFSSVVPLIGQEPQISDDQKREFLLKAEVVASKRSSKGVTKPWRLTLSDGKVTHDASFQTINERRQLADLPREERKSTSRTHTTSTSPPMN